MRILEFTVSLGDSWLLGHLNKNTFFKKLKEKVLESFKQLWEMDRQKVCSNYSRQTVGACQPRLRQPPMTTTPIIMLILQTSRTQAVTILILHLHSNSNSTVKKITCANFYWMVMLGKEKIATRKIKRRRFALRILLILWELCYTKNKMLLEQKCVKCDFFST